MGWVGGGRALNKAESVENCQKLEVKKKCIVRMNSGSAESMCVYRQVYIHIYISMFTMCIRPHNIFDAENTFYLYTLIYGHKSEWKQNDCPT